MVFGLILGVFGIIVILSFIIARHVKTREERRMTDPDLTFSSPDLRRNSRGSALAL